MDGPAVLASEWMAPPDDTLSLRLLAGVSGHMRDTRVLEAALSAARNSSLQVQVRLAALRTLVNLYNPCFDMAYRMPAKSEPRSRITIMLGQRDHPLGRDGGQPLGQGDSNRILQAIVQLGKDDTDLGFRDAAKRLSDQLERSDVGARPNCSGDRP